MQVIRKKCVKSFKSNTRVFDDDSIEVTPQEKGEPSQKDVKKVGRSKRYATTGKNPLTCIELKCPADVEDKAAFFQKELNRVKSSLAIPNGDPAHDRSEVFRKEKALLNWLKGMSVAKLFDWFDAIQETTVDSPVGRARWRTETIERDRLFLTRLGVLKS